MSRIEIINSERVDNKYVTVVNGVYHRNNNCSNMAAGDKIVQLLPSARTAGAVPCTECN